jgi:hypothetical protein
VRRSQVRDKERGRKDREIGVRKENLGGIV